MFVDSHCHLDFPELAAHLDEVLAAMRINEVNYALTVNVDPRYISQLIDLIKNYKNIFASVGLHPENCDAPETSAEELAMHATNPKIVAVGETGLDYYHVPEKAEWQRKRFRNHIHAAHLAKKPLIVHTRDAAEDTIQILREEKAWETGGVMHCFTGDWQTARRALDLGFYISFSGIVTYKNAGKIKEVAMKMPEDRMLIETDSPFLAPVPYRGKYPNSPAWVVYVAEELARLRKTTTKEIGRITSENFFRLFQCNISKPTFEGMLNV